MATQTDAQLTAAATVIQAETTSRANTATRVGTLLNNIVSNKINVDKLDTDGTLSSNSDGKIATQKAVKTYVDATTATDISSKEDTANKSANVALGTSDILFPTQKAVKTYVDAQLATSVIKPKAFGTVSPGDISNSGTTITVPLTTTLPSNSYLVMTTIVSKGIPFQDSVSWVNVRNKTTTSFDLYFREMVNTTQDVDCDWILFQV